MTYWQAGAPPSGLRANVLSRVGRCRQGGSVDHYIYTGLHGFNIEIRTVFRKGRNVRDVHPARWQPATRSSVPTWFDQEDLQTSEAAPASDTGAAPWTTCGLSVLPADRDSADAAAHTAIRERHAGVAGYDRSIGTRDRELAGDGLRERKTGASHPHRQQALDGDAGRRRALIRCVDRERGVCRA